MVASASTVDRQDRTALLLVLSVFSFLLGPLTGVPAWLMANQDLRDVRMGILDPSLQGRLQLARIIGILGTFINVLTLFLLFVLAMIAFVFLQVALEMAVS